MAARPRRRRRGRAATPAGFQLAFVFGLAAALACTVLAAFIPAPRRGTESHPALPGRR